MTKFCKDCIHGSNKGAGWFCLRSKEQSFVTGEFHPIYKGCHSERGHFGGCGKDARYFEPKATSELSKNIFKRPLKFWFW